MQTSLGEFCRIWWGSGGYRRGATASFAEFDEGYRYFTHAANDIEVICGSQNRNLADGYVIPDSVITKVYLYHDHLKWIGLADKSKPYIITDDHPEGIPLFR